MSHVHRWLLHGFPRLVVGMHAATVHYRCGCGKRKTVRTSRVRAVEVAR